MRRADDVMERRLSALVEEFKEQLKTVKEDAVDWEFVRSEAFLDLTRQAVEAAIRTRDQQKIEFVARVLRGALVEGDAGGYSFEEYLGLISNLTRRELAVTLSLYKSRPGIKHEPYETWKEKACASLRMDSSDLSVTPSRIASSGLIERVKVNSTKSELGYLRASPVKRDVIGLRQRSKRLCSFYFRKPNHRARSTVNLCSLRIERAAHVRSILTTL